MGMSYRQYLAGARIYGCSTCKTHLATIHSMLSRVRPGRFSMWMGIRKDLRILGRKLRLSTVNMAGHISLRECEIPHGRSLNPLIGLAHTMCGCRVNVVEGKPCDRQMTTGNHTVRDIYCIKCGVTLGWKYVRRFGWHRLTRSFSHERISF